MIGNVAGVKHESTVGAALLSCRYGDFAVLYYLVAPIDFTDHAHCFGRIGFLHHLPMKKYTGDEFCKSTTVQSQLNGSVSITLNTYAKKIFFL